MALLRRDSNRAIVSVADSSRDTANRLHRCVGYGNSVRTQAHGFNKVRRSANTAGDDQSYIAAL